MKKRIELKEIKLKSFVTAENSAKIKGGIDQTEWCSQFGVCKKTY